MILWVKDTKIWRAGEGKSLPGFPFRRRNAGKETKKPKVYQKPVYLRSFSGRVP
jgi:hypothetical protein